jgi:REP element-mobilizing transposase RayT
MRSCQRKNNRCLNFNYDSGGYYFLTICIKNRRNFFGTIENDQIYLTDYGILANELWNEIPKHYSRVVLDDYVIMPDHIHAIVFIVGDRHACPQVNRRQNQIIPIIIGSYKSAVSKNIDKKFCFMWQKSFYDRGIRKEKEYLMIKKYIRDNPINYNKKSP